MFFSKPKLKNVSIGMASSSNKDSTAAAKEAATQALAEAGGQATFSIVYVSSDCDPKQVCEGINSVLGTNWVGASVDKQILSKQAYNKDASVSVLCLKSEYLHFGVGVADNYKKNPLKSGTEAVKSAMSNVKSDKYVDSYIQFTRSKTQDYSNIVRTPPYFIFTIAGSQTKKKGNYVNGEEAKFLEGILEHTGPNIPVFGFGAGSDFDKFMDNNIKNLGNFQFANGKVYTESGIVLFIISNLYFELNVQHGHSTTKDFVIVTKLDKTGNEILELNGKEPVEEYCRLINVPKSEYLKDSFSYSLKRPLGLIAFDGSTYIKEAFPNPDGKTMHCSYNLKINTAMNILQYNKDSLLNTMTNIVTESKQDNRGKNIAIALFSHCCSRRVLIGGEEGKVNQLLFKKYKDVPFFGCYAFSEIGATKRESSQVHSETVTSLILFDSLLSG